MWELLSSPCCYFYTQFTEATQENALEFISSFCTKPVFFLKCDFLVTKQGAKATEIKLKLKPTCFLFLFPLSVFVFAATHKHKSSYLTVCFAAC